MRTRTAAVDRNQLGPPADPPRLRSIDVLSAIRLTDGSLEAVRDHFIDIPQDVVDRAVGRVVMRGLAQLAEARCELPTIVSKHLSTMESDDQ